MKTAASAIAWLDYVPRLVYRDLLLPVDRHHAEALQERDAEVFARHGRFCRRALPGEFVGEEMTLMDVNHLVVVDFGNGRWHRQLGARRLVPAVKTRGGKR